MKYVLVNQMWFLILVGAKESMENESLGQRLLLTDEQLTLTNREATGDCGQPRLSDISLLLYTRSNPTRPTTLTLNNIPVIDSRKKIILLIHGWFSASTSYAFRNLKNAYLKRYDSNLIMVDWSRFSFQAYPASVCFLPNIARLVGGFLCRINNQRGMPLRTVHLVGTSLGGQMSGLIGQETKSICKEEIGRISALDPAGPLFQGLPKSQRLDKSDAIFVDVIHTNKGVLGYYGNCGNVDFYPNCGVLQNGCPLSASCDHTRSLNYMIESIHSNNFKAKLCKYCPGDCISGNSNKARAVMGEGCSTNTSAGAYVLWTNPIAPFALG